MDYKYYFYSKVKIDGMRATDLMTLTIMRNFRVSFENTWALFKSKCFNINKST
jgi:hypothetical protein